MAKTGCPAVVWIVAARFLPEIDSYFPVFDPFHCRVGSVIVDLAIALVCSVVAAGLVPAVAAVLAVVDFAAAVVDPAVADFAVACFVYSSLAATGKGREAVVAAAYFLIPRSFSLRNRNSLSPLCSAVPA